MAIAMTAGRTAAAVLVARAGANLPIGVNNSQPIHGFLRVDLGFQEHVKEWYQILQEKTQVWFQQEKCNFSFYKEFFLKLMMVRKKGWIALQVEPPKEETQTSDSVLGIYWECWGFEFLGSHDWSFGHHCCWSCKQSYLLSVFPWVLQFARLHKHIKCCQHKLVFFLCFLEFCNLLVYTNTSNAVNISLCFFSAFLSFAIC